jgi:hypothetical protein
MARPPEIPCLSYISIYIRVAEELCGFHITYSEGGRPTLGFRLTQAKNFYPLLSHTRTVNGIL